MNKIKRMFSFALLVFSLSSVAIYPAVTSAGPLLNNFGVNLWGSGPNLVSPTNLGNNNIPPVPSQNLILNPELEDLSPLDPNIPDHFNKGYEDPGSITSYIYPDTTAPQSNISTGKAAKIVATSFVSGSDAKWYPDLVQVISGKQYSFSNSFIADVSTDLVGVFCTDQWQNSCSYSFVSLSPTNPNTWVKSSTTFTVPSGMSYMTVFHRINKAGTLTVDNYDLHEAPLPQGFSSGFVTLAFDDGFLSQYQNALPKLIAGNVRGTFFGVTHSIAGLSINNPSMENFSGGVPVGWTKAGNGYTSFSYTTDAHIGLKAVKVASNYEYGLGYWYFNKVTIQPDTIYSFKEWYKSSGEADIVAQVTMNDGSIQNAAITDINGNYLGETSPLDISPEYSEVEIYFYVPNNAKSVTVLNRLTDVGFLTIDDVSMGGFDYMNKEQVLELQDHGNEIAGHSQTHKDLTTLSSFSMNEEVNGGRQEMVTNDIAPVLSFAYPYGKFNQAVKQALMSAGFISGRTINPGFNGKDTPVYELKSQSILNTTTLAQIKSWIDTAKNDKTWLILTFHQVENNTTNLPFSTTPLMLENTINYLNSQNIPVRTVLEGVEDFMI
ncbi:MAG: polysaccharide deacetylase family protein [bacterium]|nr:polysaccharide deacetylase family protein [bacterium]